MLLTYHNINNTIVNNIIDEIKEEYLSLSGKKIMNNNKYNKKLKENKNENEKQIIIKKNKVKKIEEIEFEFQD